MARIRNKTVFIMDRSSDSAERLKQNISGAGFDIVVCSDPGEIPGVMDKISPDILIIDSSFYNNKTTMNFIVKGLGTNDIPVVVVTESLHNSMKRVNDVIDPCSFLSKPVNEYELKSNIDAALHRYERQKELRENVMDEIRRREVFGNMSGESPAIRDVFLSAAAVMERNINVLITGESGTGKELLARAIHKGSTRKGPFVAINCAAISTELSESLLFGHRRGAFTGAIDDSPGYFEQADGGTIFLDEIGDMKPDVQAKVLRVIEDRKIRRVGDKAEKDVDVRIVSATNRDLKGGIEEKEFRGDLYYRLEEYGIQIPPLRERRDDIPVLAEYFLESFCIFYEIEPMQISSAVMEELMQYRWPGNIRELKNVIQRAAIQGDGRLIKRIDFAERPELNTVKEKITPAAAPSVPPYGATLREIEKYAIEDALEKTQGNVARAASLLDIGRATLYRKIEKLDIKVSEII